MKTSKEKEKSKVTRRKRIANLDRTRYTAQHQEGQLPTNSTMWKTTQCPDFLIKYKYFLWMTMHDAYKVGDY